MNKPSFCVILLAVGVGKRMGQAIPKQYLPLQGKLIVLYSFEMFLSLPNVQQIIVVCEPSFEAIFKAYTTDIPLSFARPGDRRQDSLFNGIQTLEGNPLVCVHDAARPFIQAEAIQRIMVAAEEHGAAVLGSRLKSTIKICDSDQFVTSTPDRSKLWEIQTPQVVRLDLLKKGFQAAALHDLTVTDDVSLAELIGHPVKVVEGASSNIKVTAPEDLLLAEQILDKLCIAIS